jgi:hypothetical protein
VETKFAEPKAQIASKQKSQSIAESHECNKTKAKEAGDW